MKLETAIYKLPLRCDPVRLHAEIAQFDARHWHSFPGEPPDSAALILVSVGGTPNADFALSGPVRPTPLLEQCPYLSQVLAAIHSPITRCRVIHYRATTTVQTYWHYHWWRRMPISIPIGPEPTATLVCADTSLSLDAGHFYVFDPAQPHQIVLPAGGAGLHLVIETPGSPWMRQMLAAAEQPGNGAHTPDPPVRLDELPYQPGHHPAPEVEPYRFMVLTPEELAQLATEITTAPEVQAFPATLHHELSHQLAAFQQQWQTTFAHYGHERAGELAYRDLVLQFDEQVLPLLKRGLPSASPGLSAAEVIHSMMWIAPPVRPRLNWQLLVKRKRNVRPLPPTESCPEFLRPIFIVSAPRAGSTLLFETLARYVDVWTILEESHETIEGIEPLHPAAHRYTSNRLTEADAVPDVVATLHRRFAAQLRHTRHGNYYDLPPAQRPPQVRLLEKTPKNALRIPFLRAAFPNAQFLYLYRDPAENISSMLEGWRSRRFVAYQHMPGWPYRAWSFLLVPGWSELRDRPVVEIAAYQWRRANEVILADLQALPQESWQVVRYADLIHAPQQTIQRVCAMAGLPLAGSEAQFTAQSLPVSDKTLSLPAPDKWRKHAWEITPLLPALDPIGQAVHQLAHEQQLRSGEKKLFGELLGNDHDGLAL